MFIFILILAVGSFINVLTLRWKPAEENRLLKIIQGRSHCFHCGGAVADLQFSPSILTINIQKGRF
jgi:prepilin signal peptidase PulO-like enzyme (type II secretory pathway)